MAEHSEESVPRGEKESVTEKLADQVHSHGSSSDSDSERPEPSSFSVKSRIYRLFGREKPVHQVLGGGKPADVLLWRNKKVSAGVLGLVTAIWVLFELFDYHLVTLVSYGLLFTLVILFLWSNATTFINKSPPRIPEVSVPEDLALDIALSVRYEINRGFAVLRDIVVGRDLKKFLAVVAGLWFLSFLGSSCDFLTLIYIAFILLHSVPVLYEKYDDKVDSFAEKSLAEMKRHYNLVQAKVMAKVPRRSASVKDKKHQ
ncbi:Reticulon-like protein B3 [Apostasia shenzhenica]|uniref:Reticulon-like protein n=1 Tax=Apostasia shenzhenica TaxID=1088818 RepID=A0A2I0B940_9ASPA|nr:Reticulon-like protein B3 [Apostasia shenzhenica]